MPPRDFANVGDYPPLAAGESATMTLTFDTKQQATVDAVVRPLAAMSAR